MAEPNWWDASPLVEEPAPGPNWWDSSPSAVLQPSPGVQPASALDRFMTGAGDVVHGGAQALVNMLPTGAVEGVNNATRWVNEQPVIGPVTQALGMVPATREGINQNVQQREVDYQEARRLAETPRPDGTRPQPGTDWMRGAGGVAVAVPAALAVGAPASLTGAALSGAGQGALFNTLQPVTDPTLDFDAEKRRQALLGGAMGGAGGAAGYGLGRLLTGARNVDPNVRTLNDAGVRMTPGQMAGGYPRRIEDAVGSVPVVGARVRAAQREGMESFNRAVANNVLEPIGQRVDDAAAAGRNLVDDVYTRIGQVYDDVLPRARPFGPDAEFMQDLRQVGQQFLTPDSRRQFQGFMQNNILSRANGGQIDGRTFKLIEEELGRAFREYRLSAAPADREFAKSALAVQRAFRELLARSNPDIAPEVRAANGAFARYIRMERAASGNGAVEGVFSPAQFSGAVASSDTSARRGAVARGAALMQELSDAGRAVLPSQVPDSGTPERLLLASLLSGNVGAAAAGVTNPMAAGMMGAGWAAYTNPMQRAYQAALLAQRPRAVQAVGDAIAAGAGAGGVTVPLAGMLLSPPQRADQRR